jgi:ASC-1-like (ASCH) protein
MSYNLFLDDMRKPEHAYIHPKRDGNSIVITSHSLENMSGVPNNGWVVVRTYEDFVQTIEERGIPNVVSFDHDLDEEHIRHYYKVTESTGVIEYGNLKVKTGKHCAEYLVQQCKAQQPKNLPEVFIHSANKWGVKEIRKVLENLC